MINTEKVLENTIQRCRDNNMIIPTYAQMRNPKLVPNSISKQLKSIGLWDLNPLNLFRITWKNEPVKSGGGYGEVNHVILPKSLTGVDAKIIVLIGKYFPKGWQPSHEFVSRFGDQFTENIYVLGNEFHKAWFRGEDIRNSVRQSIQIGRILAIRDASGRNLGRGKMLSNRLKNMLGKAFSNSLVVESSPKSRPLRTNSGIRSQSGRIQIQTKAAIHGRPSAHGQN